MRRFLGYFINIIFYIILFGCAHPGTPGGGPKDMRPPEVIKSEPENKSAHFKSKKIVITFDEFIELDNIMQKAIISPPMQEFPDFKVKGKSLQIKFNEPLKDSTTYSIYFADALVDITERNPLLNYTYIFSTGSKVDSLSLFGSITNSFNLEPAEDVYVMLYKDNNDTLPIDSLPFNVIPYYVSKTTADGDFQFNGLGDHEYLMFALKDLNANYIFDQPGEEVAFLDSLIKPFFVQLLDIDSLRADTVMFAVADTLRKDQVSLVRDSLIHHYIHEYESKFPQLALSLFKETDSVQRILKASVTRKNNIQFAFAWPTDNIEIIPKNFNADTTWYVEEISKDRDTINWYLKDLPIDTLEVLIMNQQDSVEYLYLKLDPSKNKPLLSRRQQKKEDEKEEFLEIRSNIGKGSLKLNQQPEFYFYHPVKEVITDSILLIIAEDSIYTPGYLFLDSLRMKILFPVELTEETRYGMVFPDSSIIDWNGYHNEEYTSRFATKSLRDYGTLVLNLKPKTLQPFVLQLMSNNQELLKEFYFSSDTTLTIAYLDPAQYILKIIFDDNGNKQWDSGNYKYKIQPERVLFYQKTIEVRANWEIIEDWTIE